MTNLSLEPSSAGLEDMCAPGRDSRSRPMLLLPFTAAVACFRALATWLERRKQRLHLDSLEDHLLKDIGVSRRQARREASRWF